ncbi:MAG: Lrp/AsnC family transcriptional regulator [Deltaproteobacteria bacterium]|jgi:DNA-binding Lrp family transcriptional regulator|nr:Lrp/AsnC family transcriptional regulator [Deltaproteobacteria bacterium]
MEKTPPDPLTEAQLRVLRIVQEDLPDSLTPYADMAADAGMEEDEVLALLRTLKETGSIRRFGASLRHQRAGFAHNAMVAWKADREEADKAGQKAAEHPLVSHAYYRPACSPDWPYTLYTMIHARSPEECAAVVAELAARTCLQEYVVLESLRELKKISMAYF